MQVMMVPGEPQQSLVTVHMRMLQLWKGAVLGCSSHSSFLAPSPGPTLRIWAKPSGRVPRLRAVLYFWSTNGAAVPGELIKHHLRGLHSQAGWWGGCKPHPLAGLLLQEMSPVLLSRLSWGHQGSAPLPGRALHRCFAVVFFSLQGE